MNALKMEHLMGITEGTKGILGKFLYFSLSNILIDRDTLFEICESMNLPVMPGNRLGAVDAFKSATGDIYERVVKKEDGVLRISKVYCRDNQKNNSVYSRELVKETLGETTNRYKKLANLSFDKEYDHFDYTVEAYDPDVDIYKYCDKAADLFEVYKRCAGRNQIKNMTASFLKMMESLKITVHGRLFFIPKKYMHMLDIFEDFVEALNKNNQRNGELPINSMFVIDDAKQRDKMTTEFYNATRKEIEMYTEKLEYLIASGSQSPAVMERWVLKIKKLEDKKQHYEDILRHELNDLDDQYATLKFLAQELSIRASKLRLSKCA